MPLAARDSLTGAYILLFLVSYLLGSTSAQVQLCGHDVYDVESLKKYWRKSRCVTFLLSLLLLLLFFFSPPHRQPTWFANIKDPTQCASGSGDSTCTVKFSVCGPLPPDVCGDGNSTGFCQIINSPIPIEHDTGKQSLIVSEASKCFLVIFTDSDKKYENGHRPNPLISSG